MTIPWKCHEILLGHKKNYGIFMASENEPVNLLLDFYGLFLPFLGGNGKVIEISLWI